MYELVGDPGADLGAKLPSDEIQHHVHRRRAAGTGKAVPIYRVNASADRDVRELLGQCGIFLPMDAAPVPVQHTGTGQEITARAGRAQRQAACAASAQPVHYRLLALAFDPFAPAHHDSVEFADPNIVADSEIDADREPVAGGNRAAALGNHAPAVDLGLGHPIGHTQCLDRRRNGDEREIFQEQETETGRQYLRIVTFHGANNVS